MYQMIRTKLCWSFQLTILLFPFSSTTSEISPIEDCKETMATYTQCECLPSFRDLLFQCPANATVPQIRVKISNSTNYVQVKIEYNDNESNPLELLPKIDIGNVNSLRLSHYPSSSGPISHLVHHLGIKQLEEIGIAFSDTLKAKISHEFLSGVTELTQLFIYNIDLSHISENIFMDLPNLKELMLSSANMQFSPIVDLEDIVTLNNLSRRNLKQLPAGIFRNQSKLEELWIIYSQLQNISKDLFEGASSIKKLYLSNNAIENIPADTFSLLPNLEEIYLGGNDIQKLPPNIFSHNQKLRRVEMTENRVPLKTLPSALFKNLTNLQSVSITCGTTDYLSEQGMSKYVDRTVSIHCGLSDIPAKFFECINALFNDISLAHNELVAIDGILFSRQFNLYRLDLSHNRLKTLPNELFHDLSNLIEIYLSYNQLNEISSRVFGVLPSLKTLHIGNNRLVAISPNLVHEHSSPFQFLLKLQELNLRNNKLSYIFSDWHKMKELKELDLSYNNITSLNSSDLHFHSNKELSINLSHNHIRYINFQNITILANSLSKTISLQLNYNPLDCDCNLLPFAQYERERTHKKLNLVTDELFCQTPEDMKGLKIRNVEPQKLLCPVDFKKFPLLHCPNECNCFQRASVLIVNCSNKYLKDVPMLPRALPSPFKSIELHIENNALRELPTISTDVTEIYAAGNSLFQIDVSNLPQNLTYLDLSHNAFKELNTEMINFFNKSTLLRKVALSGNPWNCECKGKPLLMFVTNSHNSNTTISDIDHLYCTSPRHYKMTDYVTNDICKGDQIVINASLAIIAFLGFSIGLTVAFYHKYQAEIKVWMYKYRICSCYVNEAELDKDKIYDAFVSYSHKDEEFVAKYLVPELEEGPIRFKLCVHVRDFVVGECIPDQIVRAIDSSRRTIIVLSMNFINSVWAQLEFRQAHQAGLNEGRARLIVILYEKLGDIKSLDRDLQAYLTTTTYLEWGNPWFWDRLRYAMPHPLRTLNNLVQRPLRRNEDDNVELNDIKIFQISRENDLQHMQKGETAVII